MDKLALATWGVVVSICVLGLFYPNALLWGVTLFAGLLAWIAGWFVSKWSTVLHFVAAVILVFLILSAWCGQRTFRAVLQLGVDDAGVQHWHPDCCRAANCIREMRDIAGAIGAELLLPIVLLLGFVALIEAVANLLSVESQWEDLFTSIFSAAEKVWSHSPADIHQEILKALAAFKDPAEKMIEKGIALITATISVSISLILFLFRRRGTHLSGARVIYQEMDLIVRQSFQSVPKILAGRDNLTNRPRGQLLIGASSDRQFLLLDPGTGLAAKLPSCLLRAGVAFFQADLALNQVYNGLISPAFAKADARRREAYLAALDEEWRASYQPTAFAALFRIGFYMRLRSWSI